MRNRSVAPAPLDRHGVAWRLFLTCWLVYVLLFATNSVRELFPALTLGDRLSFDVSEYLGMHPDIFELPGRGAYIDNNPGASILGAIPYALARPIVDRVVARVQQTRAAHAEPLREYQSIYPLSREFVREAEARGLDVKLGLGAAVTQAGLMAPLSALSAVLMFLVLSGRLTRRIALLLSLLYAFATPVLYRTAQLNHNLLLGHAAFAAFVLLWRPWDEPSRPKRPRFLAAGLLIGWCLVLDYSGIVAVAALGLYGLARWASLPRTARSWADIPAFALGVSASVVVLLGYQWIAFGNPIYPAQHYMPATPLSVHGFNGMDWPQLDLLWDTTFGLRFGLFTSAPILLLAFWPPAWRDRAHRLFGVREMWCILGFTLGFFLFASATQYGRLQFNSGVRYVVPAVPFLFLVIAPLLARMPFRLAIALGVLGTYWSVCLAMYRDVELGWGIFESLIHVTTEGPRLPWLLTLERLGYVAPGAVGPVLLLAGAAVVAIWLVQWERLGGLLDWSRRATGARSSGLSPDTAGSS